VIIHCSVILSTASLHLLPVTLSIGLSARSSLDSGVAVVSKGFPYKDQIEELFIAMVY